MERRKEDRSFWLLLLLSFVTCGIYGLIFYWNLFRDINVVCRPKESDDSQQSPNYLIACLLSIVTCGIYFYYWYYKQGNRMQRAGREYGIEIDENGTTYLLWGLVGTLLLGVGHLFVMYFLIKNTNRLSICFNREYIDGGAQRYSGGYDRNYYENSNRNYGYGDQSDAFQNGNNGGNHFRNDYGNMDYDIPTIGLRQGMLVCTRGMMSGAQIPVQDRETVTIGRDSTACNLILTDMDISRRHCTVQFSGSENCYYVTDYSSFGVVVNGIQKLEKNVMTKCEKGTRILLGEGSNEFLLQ